MNTKKKKYKSLDDLLKDYSFMVKREDLDNLSIDYWQNPVKRGAMPLKEDLEYLYQELNLSLEFLTGYFDFSNVTIGKWIKLYNLGKSKKQASEVSKKVNQHRYGVDFPSQLEKVKEKNKKTCLDKYGVDNAAKTETTKKKFRQTCLDKYGVDNHSKCKEIYDKVRKTNLEKYGFETCTQNPEIIKKIKDRVPEMIEKMKATNLEKYGTEFPLSNEEIRAKRDKTCLEKYGNEIFSKSDYFQERLPEIIEKSRQIKREHGSFGKSKEEDKIYSLLSEKYPSTIRQYSDSRYPFACDFYIPELDLFIEYQGFWSHGKEPYDSENAEHQQKVEKWKSKRDSIRRKDYYNAALNTWTIRDPLKREIAKKNNLNWIEFFTFEYFMAWFQSCYVMSCEKSTYEKN